MSSFRDFIRFALVVVALVAFCHAASAKDALRIIPKPLPEHPGNIFLFGEEAIVPAAAEAAQWKLVDIDGRPAGSGTLDVKQQQVSLGRPGVGWYRADFFDAEGKPLDGTTIGVLAALKAPTPADSPVSADSATAWFAKRYENQPIHQEILANLAALAGVNWIRDRLSWGDIQKDRGEFAVDTIYDSSAALASKHGLNVLQVFHSTPGWAIDKKLDGQRAWSRFPRDLRDHYAFSKAMGRCFQQSVRAWEPWNEANIEPFGGHTIDEMCSLQKAAYLGFKGADPDLTVCWNVYAGSGSPLHSEGVVANESWPYFETYNIHSYSAPDRYESQFATARDAACGRPIWITECGIRLTTRGEKPWGDLTAEDQRVQARFIAPSYASSLFAGVERHFFFILGNYVEGDVQFGLLRHDHTPRPGYLALAAVGRFLAGAKCLGRLAPTVHAFRAQPDGCDREVLVAWGEGAASPLPADLRVEAVFDHIGRSLGAAPPSTLKPEAVFIVMPPGECKKLELEAPPARSPRRDGELSPVVLQLSLPAHTARLNNQAHEIEPGVDTQLPLFVYNFAEQPVSGTLAVEDVSPGWKVQLKSEPVRVDPMGRQKVPASVTIPSSGLNLLAGAWIKLRGDFGPMGRPVLAFRLAADLLKLRPAETRPIPAADEPARWKDNIVSGGMMSHQARTPSGVLFDMRFADADPWAYPRLPLIEQEVPDDRCDGLALNVAVLEGTGTIRVQFVEEGGASYLAEASIDTARRELQRAVVLFRQCKWGSFSKPDSDGKLQPAKIREILVGINSKENSTAQMAVDGLEWVRF